MGHTPDKACESFFGYNSVLPGAYSMFRWAAIQGRPLEEFFKGLRMNELSCSEANKFLAEDRVMCLEIFIKEGARYYLTYVPDAKAYTDAPDSLAVLIKQRRRWMNGSLFGTHHVIKNIGSVLSCKQTKHPCCHKFFFAFFMMYYTFAFLLSFLILGAMYSAITVFMQKELETLV